VTPDADPTTAQERPLDLFVEHLTHVDCGVLDTELGLIGRTWLVDVVLTGRRDEHGMLFDFGPAKREIKAEIDALIDHRLLVPLRAPGLSRHGHKLALTTADGARIDYEGPATGTATLDAERITTDLLQDWLTERLRALLPANIDCLELTLHEETIPDAHYHYCHGLRTHDGNCQRMAHGHRCRLGVAIDDHERPDIARDWAARWQGVFIGQRADLAHTDDAGRHHFAYTAPQGDFALAIDAARCIVLDGPPTVENIADHIAGELARAHPGQRVAVRAYEGVGKGAIARRGG